MSRVLNRSCPRQRVGQHGGILSRLIALLLMVAVLGALYLFRRPILRGTGGFWIVDESLQASDAIVVLGDDTYRAERASRAAELYRAGWAPHIVASGRWLRPYISIPELMERDLVERGVPREAIVRWASSATNTLQEARAFRVLLRERGWSRVLVVTSNYHTRRSRYIFRKVLGPEVQLRVVAAPDSGYDPRTWWHSRSGLRLFFHESVGLPVALWELLADEDQPDPPRLAR